MAREMSTWEKQIRKALIDKDMSMSDLARELNISVAYIYDIISGARKATDIRQRINKYLGIEDE